MSPHLSVMRNEVIEALKPAVHQTYIDATFGAGGYTRGILESFDDVRVIALDRDPDAIKRSQPLKDQYGDRFSIVQTCFGDMESAVPQGSYDGVVFDLGVSSPQLDEAERGFSFRQDGPLDMRMSQSGKSAADLVNKASDTELADIIWKYGEERHSRRIAKAICMDRVQKPFQTTQELAELIRRIVPGKPGDIDPATRTFQALRIAVNDELGELERGLEASENLLQDGGRLVVVSFHSLEDRIVKDFFRKRTGKLPQGSRFAPAQTSKLKPTFRQVVSKSIAASAEEIAINPRARSAKLRWGVRTREDS